MQTKNKIRLTSLSHGAGWACKIGPSDLAQVLGNLKIPNHKTVQLGFETSDDSAVVDLKDGTTIIQTVDFFTPVVDDPYHFGQIAAANALSDIYAMGGDPLFALNIVPSFLSKTLTLSVAEITLVSLFKKTFSADNLNKLSITSTLPVA